MTILACIIPPKQWIDRYIGCLMVPQRRNHPVITVPSKSNMKYLYHLINLKLIVIVLSQKCMTITSASYPPKYQLVLLLKK